MDKIRATIFYYPEMNGTAIRFIKQVNGKRYVIDMNRVQYIEMEPYNMTLKSFIVDEVEDWRSPKEKGNLAGENEALKNEIKFLREQITKLLEKV